MMAQRAFWTLLFFGALALQLGCEDQGKKSARLVEADLAHVVAAAQRDVGEVRRGMPAGAQELSRLFAEADPEMPASADARRELLRLRDDNLDLSAAKSTFFLIAHRDGTILRNNLEEDEMVDQDLFAAYPGSRRALAEDYLEFTGSWELARGVNGRPDAQWLAASRVMVKDKVAGLFVTGWSWSSYAYRLETALRSHVLGETEEGGKVPLHYVYVIVGGKAYGAPVAPEVNGKAILEQNPLQKAKAEAPLTLELEITHREFGLGLQKVPELGDDVVLAVLRSET